MKLQLAHVAASILLRNAVKYEVHDVGILLHIYKEKKMNLNKLAAKIGNKAEVKFGTREVKVELVDARDKGTEYMYLKISGLPVDLNAFLAPDDYPINVALECSAETDCGLVVWEKQGSHKKNNAVKFMFYDLLDD